MKRFAVLLLLLSVLRPLPGWAQATPCASVEILSDDLGVVESESYCRYAEGERQKVNRFWGDTWDKPIRIHVSGSYRISRALVPAYRGNRGFLEMPTRRVRNRDGALLHEIVHIYAPNDNRFLAEGLAVYLHDKLAGNAAFPNFAKPLGGLARARLAGVDSLEILNGVRTPKPLATVMDERDAYILAGSFVGFLIEMYGLPEFKRLYESGNYESAYGKPLQVLEQEWRAALK
jgi:hypothetical protein